MIKDSPVAQTYAKALLLAAQGQKIDPRLIYQQLNEILMILKSSPLLMSKLQYVLTPLSEKRKILLDIMSRVKDKSLVVDHFLDLLLSRKRLALFGIIVDQFEILMQESQGIIKAEVWSAVTLSPDAQKKLESELSLKWNGRQVLCNVKLDPGLISGLIVKVGDVVIDNSLRSKLRRLSQNFNRVTL